MAVNESSMAVTKEQVLELLSKDDETAEVKAQSITELFKKDFDEQINKIKMNREAIKAEKTEEINKRHAVEEKNRQLEDEVASLKEQVKASSSDEMQKLYDSRLAETQKGFDGQLAELKAKLEASESTIKTLNNEKFKLSCMEEFNKAIVGKNVAPDAVSDLSRYVLGDGCSKFSVRSLGGDETMIATEDGKSIKAVLEDVLNNTTFGKRCVVVNSSGGGAEGGVKGAGSAANNPWKKETFNLTKQAELVRKDPQLAAALKAQAQA